MRYLFFSGVPCYCVFRNVLIILTSKCTIVVKTRERRIHIINIGRIILVELNYIIIYRKSLYIKLYNSPISLLQIKNFYVQLYFEK